MNGQINGAIRSAGDSRSKADGTVSKINNNAGQMNNFWTGDAGKRFIEECHDIERQIALLKNHLQRLANDLQNVASNILRADEERRQKELERRRKQNENMHKTYYRW